ncbi:MAG: sensor histidine kinase [Phycisphaerae bacterium]|nr:sensor histidine kinase [Phycisphaerae bacterium]MCZ2400911.1 sensor histidine kinase [Phycisphaerae bacterium]NUQ48914.1 sensor histidine kinase [Phycisphaerae bacterium]
MSLRSKLSLFVLAVSAILGTMSFAVQQLITAPGFERAEIEGARRDVSRCADAIANDVDGLLRLAAAIGPEAESWFDDNGRSLADGALQQMELDLFALIGGNAHRLRDRLTGTAPREQLVQELRTAIIGRRAAEPHHYCGPRAGLMMTSAGPMAVAFWPLCGPGRVECGEWLVLGRAWGAEKILALGRRTMLSVSVRGMEELTRADGAALAHLDARGSVWVDTSRKSLHAYTLLRDVDGAPALLVQAEMPRIISQHARNAAGLALGTSVVGTVVLMLVLWWLMAHYVVKRLVRLTEHAVRVGREPEHSPPLDLPGRDEIATLAREIDHMVAQLAELRSRTAETARRSGRADVAVQMLHNVGNILNSVNVSASVVSKTLRQSEAPRMREAAAMLRERQADLATFLSSDERGRQLPTYLVESAQVLAEEREALLREVDRLSQAVEHIRAIVDGQQVHGAAPPMLERVDVAAALEQALALCEPALRCPGVTIERRTRSLAPVLLDKHRFLQIVVNLISNALAALRASGRSDPRLTIAASVLRQPASSRLIVSITDNGVGIPPENLAHLFRLGFSTRSGGRGIGLHSAANLAVEMGGVIKVRSGGKGRGATFALDTRLAPEGSNDDRQ